MPRLEWRFGSEDVLGDGDWFIDHGDPHREAIISLKQVIQISDDPVFCLVEHFRVMDKVVAAVDELLGAIEAVAPQADGRHEGRLPHDAPLATALVKGYSALRHVQLQAVDALVECRTGRIEQAMTTDPVLSAEIAFTLAASQNALWWLGARLPLGPG